MLKTNLMDEITRKRIIMEMAASIIAEKIMFNKLVSKNIRDRQESAELIGKTGNLQRALETIEDQNGNWQ